jgi:hypothetical protein
MNRSWPEFRNRLFISVFCIALTLTGCKHPTEQTALRPPPPFTYHYKTDHYIDLAIDLQSLGKDQALKRLHSMAQSDETMRNYGSEVFILCRMLFIERPDSIFRGPRIGGGTFFGGTQYSDWPRVPIELVDGIPFLITQGYLLAGLAETPSQYLDYCKTNCDWSPFQFKAKSNTEKLGALDKLFTSPKWKRLLEPYEKQFLSDQIQ